jgi:hypothetical protein
MSLPVIPVYEGCMQRRITKIIRKTDNPFFWKKKTQGLSVLLIRTQRVRTLEPMIKIEQNPRKLKSN